MTLADKAAKYLLYIEEYGIDSIPEEIRIYPQYSTFYVKGTKIFKYKFQHNRVIIQTSAKRFISDIIEIDSLQRFFSCSFKKMEDSLHYFNELY